MGNFFSIWTPMGVPFWSVSVPGGTEPFQPCIGWPKSWGQSPLSAGSLDCDSSSGGRGSGEGIWAVSTDSPLLTPPVLQLKITKSQICYSLPVRIACNTLNNRRGPLPLINLWSRILEQLMIQES